MKSNIRRVICFIFVTVLLVCISCAPVAAETVNSQPSRVLFTEQTDLSNIAICAPSYETSDVFLSLNDKSWSTLLSNRSNYVENISFSHQDTPSIQDTDVEGVMYDVLFKQDYMYLVSFLFDDLYLFSNYNQYIEGLSDSRNITITNGIINMFTGFNCQFTKFRFSLRERDVNTNEVGDVVAVTDTFSISAMGLVDYFGEFYEQSVNNLTFKFFNSLAPASMCMTLDFFFTIEDPLAQYYIFGPYFNTYFNVLRYSSTVLGTDTPYYPELNNPFYSGPDTGILQGYSDMQKELFSDWSDFDGGLSGLIGNFSTVFTDFNNFFENVSYSLNYLTLSIPYLDTVFAASLCLGIFAFLLGMSSQFIGASMKRESRSTKSDDGYKRRQAALDENLTQHTNLNRCLKE